jgi:hypothetical protein
MKKTRETEEAPPQKKRKYDKNIAFFQKKEKIGHHEK